VPATPQDLSVELHDLLKAVRLIKQHRLSSRPGLPAATIGLLIQIDALSSDCHARELAAHAGLDPSTVSRAVASLVAQGLVERTADPVDGRASLLCVTPAGRAALDEASAWFGNLLDRALAGWTPDERIVLSVTLRRLAHDIDVTLTNNDHLEAAL
jgi:DNA-binding MarR family transcriptional regulator